MRKPLKHLQKMSKISRHVNDAVVDAATVLGLPFHTYIKGVY